MENQITTAPAPTGIAEAKPDEQVVFEQDGDELFLVARYPYQMERCQTELKVWAAKKTELVAAEVDDLQENVAIARKNGWGMSALIRAERLARKRLKFYQKIQAALDAGYCIVPNFPVDLIAVRTKRANVDPKLSTNWRDTHAQAAQELPVGEGEFRNPLPVTFQKTTTTDDKSVTRYWAQEWKDIEFPFTTAKPQILSATARALTEKVFDEIGVLPGKKKKEDPIVVGRIIDPRSDRYTKRVVTFLVAWFLETKTL